MYSIGTILLYALAAEIFRRCCLILLAAFTGPLSKIPGPMIGKFTSWPWLIQCVKGNQMNIGPGLFQKYGDVVRVGPADIMFRDKATITKILIDEDFRKSHDYETVREDPNVASLITETDKVKYKQKRRLLSPGFSIGYLNGLEPLMHECLQVFKKVLDGRCRDAGGYAVIDMNRMLGNLTSDVMSAASFGGSFNLVESDDNTQKNIFNSYLRRVALDAQFPLLRHLPGVPSASSMISGLVERIVSKRRQEMEKGVMKKDILQIFVDTHNADPISFTDKHIRNEMILFMIAGSDTTSLTAAFTLLLLLNNPDKLKELTSEIDSTFPSLEDNVTFAKTQDLPYLNAAINESMRLMPIITGGIVRLVPETTILCGYEVPKDTIVSAWVSEMQRDPRIWPDPDSFIPERWLGDYKGVPADRKAFMPFSAGSRNCIGQQFALKELRLILVTLIRRYELSLVEGQSHELRVHTVPWFKQGFYNVGVKLRS
ncbi:cytochrome P450 [Hyaloscypha variabilis F]|uniref:Cytochrome P450 n=1 Tax=Hyaloscypha variabilis (strain UAMH 11265 / GT02V1 / F) TaxID=1149755 RepID=A0A2J6R4U0_HYAVF|nr:cytochrome P450 [Hyaloscypha variabilis F]